jgi:hypothetical protein
VVEVEVSDDDEVRLRILGLESSRELVGRSGPHGDEGPRAGLTVAKDMPYAVSSRSQDPAQTRERGHCGVPEFSRMFPEERGSQPPYEREFLADRQERWRNRKSSVARLNVSGSSCSPA